MFRSAPRKNHSAVKSVSRFDFGSIGSCSVRKLASMARREGGALAWLCFAAQLLITQAVQYTINDAPTIPNAHTVQFFYLEAPFPYNAPEYIT